MSARQQSRLDHFNRATIFALSLNGLLLDGLQLADLPATVAIAIWLWLPLWIRLEAYRKRTGASNHPTLTEFVQPHRLSGDFCEDPAATFNP